MKRLLQVTVLIGTAALVSGCAVGGTAMDDLRGSADTDPWQVAIPADVGIGGEQGLLMRIDDAQMSYVAELGVRETLGGHRVAFQNAAIPSALMETGPAYLHYLDHVDGMFRLIIGDAPAPPSQADDGDDFTPALEQDLFIAFRKADGTTFATRLRGDDREQYEWRAQDETAANAFFAGASDIQGIDILFGRSSMR